ncbi:LexA family transcriptional regulator [Sphingobacterium faecium]|uniref:LexA family transcriptional regulator n=1 Tax=Sphingobacterium faecium TaxID=34087 RepID=UPI002479FABD|nr:helix-turn-helix transcriptional regulator [Sphingobacterium faecium]WGQ15620.1 helix-turn-helix transcriptional regulator [Sphingobacterium faecium]
MEYPNNNFEVIRKELGLTNRDFAAFLNIPEQTYSRVKRGIYPLGTITKRKFEEALPEINIKWLLFNEGDRDKPREVIDQNKILQNTNAKYIGQFSRDIKFMDDDGNNIFFEVSPGRYLMKTRLVTEKAKAGYLLGYDNQEYLEELPFHTINVTEFHKGHYVSFEVCGDSMDNGKRKSLGSGDIVTGRLIDRIYWQSKLHTHAWDYFIFVTKTDGILIKQVIKHDVENGILTLHSLNEDKKKYPDFEIHLDDVREIFNVVDITVKL